MEGDLSASAFFDLSVISIHTLRMEGDALVTIDYSPAIISIHTLRMEGDWDTLEVTNLFLNFNPHPPHGG